MARRHDGVVVTRDDELGCLVVFPRGETVWTLPRHCALDQHVLCLRRTAEMIKPRLTHWVSRFATSSSRSRDVAPLAEQQMRNEKRPSRERRLRSYSLMFTCTQTHARIANLKGKIRCRPCKRSRRLTG